MKKVVVEIDEDLRRQAEEAAEEMGMELCGFVEDAIRERLVRHEYWKTKRDARLKELEARNGKSAVEKSRGFMNVDRETVEAILQEPGYLDV